MIPSEKEKLYMAQIFVEEYEASTWPGQDYEDDYYLFELHKNIKTKQYFDTVPVGFIADKIRTICYKYLYSINHECSDEKEFDQLLDRTCEEIAEGDYIQRAISRFAEREINELKKYFKLD